MYYPTYGNDGNQQLSLENDEDLGRCVINKKNGSCICWDNITFGGCEQKLANFMSNPANQAEYHSTQWIEGQKCSNIVLPKCQSGS